MAFVSSGEIAALFDENLYMKSLYYPMLDQHHNHMVGGTSRLGVWKDGTMRWFESLPNRVTSMDNLTVKLTANIDDSSRLTVEVLASQTKPAIIMKFHIDGEGLFRVIAYNDLRLNNSELGDTALYDAATDSVIHYKRDTWIAIGSSQRLYEYAVGRRDQGTVLSDCQDGILSKSQIAQGSVDSAISVASKDFYLYIVAGRSYEEVRRALNELRNAASEHFERDKRYWDLLTQKYSNSWMLRQSAAVLIGHVGVRGEIPASLDTDILKFNLDTYAYLWPRDGVMVALALDRLGYWSFTRRFYEKLFLELITSDGYFYHKYNADGTYGSTWHPWTLNTKNSRAIQEDETALPVYGLWAHFVASLDYFTLRATYDSVERAAEFLASFIDDKLKLPLMSFDLWEERLGVHAYTVATVYAALRAAASLARTLGVWGKEERWGRAAKEIRDSAENYLFDQEKGHFDRTITISDGKLDSRDPTLDSSVLALALFGVVDPKNPKFISTLNAIRDRLWIRSIGGLARYENDYYQRVQGDYSGIPGNPWIITTAWLSQVYTLLGREDEARKALSWIEGVASPTGLLPEQVNPFTGGPLSVMPLAWSHAEYVNASLALSEGLSALLIP